MPSRPIGWSTDGRPAIIVDSGTATTVDAVDADGVFLGGAILPGFGLLARSLQRYTALLPLITLEELGTGPPPAVGRDTTAAIKSGLFFGQLGAVRELVRPRWEMHWETRRPKCS